MEMRIVFLLNFLLSVLILSPALASAQSFDVFATTGIVQLWDDEGNIGKGAPIGGGIGFRSPHGWGLEALAETQKAERNFDSGVRFDSTVTAARGRIMKYFGIGRAQPYAGAGLGVTRVKSIREFPSDCALVNNVFTCTGRDIFQSESTKGTVSGFAGVRIAAGNVLFVRPEFELSRAGEHMRIGGTVAIGASW
jgi:opacity protein-like surface antigen